MLRVFAPAIKKGTIGKVCARNSLKQHPNSHTCWSAVALRQYHSYPDPDEVPQISQHVANDIIAAAAAVNLNKHTAATYKPIERFQINKVNIVTLSSAV